MIKAENPEQTFEDTFLGAKPKPDADITKGLDLGKILRSDKIKDLVVLYRKKSSLPFCKLDFIEYNWY